MDIKRFCVEKDKTLFIALRKMDEAGYGTLFVVDSKMKMLGLITDGDVRRSLLNGADLQTPVTQIMNSKFMSGTPDQDRESMLQLLRRHHLRQLPILDKNGILVDAVLIDESIYPALPNPVVLMVGGMGTRLKPITEQIPKPMVSIGDKPILESILERYIQYGFQNFYFAVNYKGEMIEEHFETGKKWGVSIQYLREETRMGTAGALSLLPPMKEPFFVMNGDLLTDINFVKLFRFHQEQGSTATIAVSPHQLQVQYGVVEFENSEVKRIVEKPFHEFFVNAGIYVVNPEALSLVPSGTYLDMPQLLTHLIQKGNRVSAYTLQGYWKDIGMIADLEQARRDFKKSS